MGIFYEEVMYRPQKIERLSVEEMNIIKEDRDQLLSEIMDIFIELYNSEEALTESFWDDLKMKKEDLLDANKVKACIKRIEHEKISMDRKTLLLNALYVFLIGVAGLTPGLVVGSIGFAVGSAFLSLLGELIFLAGGVLAGLSLLNRYDTLVEKTQRAIKKVEKAIEKEEDPKNIKMLKDQLEALNKTLKTFQKAKYETDKENYKGTKVNVSYSKDTEGK